MPSVVRLSAEEIAQIKAYKDMGLSNLAISKKIERSHHVVNNYFKLGDSQYGKNQCKRGNPKISQRQRSAILRAASSGDVTAGQIKTEHNLPITKRRIQQILSKSGRFKWTKRASKPPLTKQHREARLNFARNHMHWKEEWKNVIFSDEKKFNLDGPDGLQFYWHDLNKSKEVAMSRNFGGGTVMVWAAFGFNGKTPICWISTRMNSENYVQLLEEVLLEYGDDISSDNWTFQHDNAAVHSSRVTKCWFQQNNIEVLNWPSRSPDLNPIENLWGALERKVYANGKQYHSTEEFKNGIRQAWNSIPLSALRTLIESMEKRIFELITKRGGNTSY